MPETLPCVDDCSTIALVAARKHRRLAVPGVTDHDDLVQDAWEGILTAQRSFDPSKWVKPEAWYWYKANGRVRDRFISLSHARAETKIAFLPLDVHEDPSDDGSVFHQYADPQADDPLECVEMTESAALVDTMMRVLNEREHAVVIMSFYEGVAHAVIASRLKVSVQYVSQILTRALNKMRQQCDEVANKPTCPTCLKPVVTRVIRGMCQSCYNKSLPGRADLKRKLEHKLCNTCGKHSLKWWHGRCESCYKKSRRTKWREKIEANTAFVRAADLSVLTPSQRLAVTARWLGGDAQGMSRQQVTHHSNDALKVLRGERKPGALSRQVLPHWADLGILTELQRRVVEAYYIKGLDHNEVAAIVGTSPDSVRGIASRAMKKLTARDGA